MDDAQKSWETKVERAKKVKEEWMKQFRVQMGRDYFEGKQNPGWPDNEWITINKVYAHLQAQLPALYSVDPYFYVRLKRSYEPDPEIIAAYEQRGRTRQAMLNYLKGEVKLKPKARLAVQDAHFAFGVLEAEYTAEEAENERAGEPILGDDGSELFGEDGPLVQPDTIPTNERWNACRVHPDDFIFDEDAGPLEDSWNWLGKRMRMTRKKAVDDKKLKTSVVEEMPASGGEEEQERARKKGIQLEKKEGENDNDILIFWKIYNLEDDTCLIYGEGAKSLVMEPEKIPEGIDKHPFSILRLTLRDDSPYPIPPVSQGIDQQKEYNLSRSQILRHRKRFNRKYIAIGVQDDDELSKLETGDDGTVLNITSGTIEALQDAPLDQQRYQELALLNNDMVETYGSPDSSRQISGADSATEAGILDKRLEVREGDRLSLVIDFITDLAKKLDQLVEANLTKAEAVRITGPQGEYWAQINPDDYQKINGEYEYDVNVGATRPRLPDIERSQWIAFLSQVVVPLPHILTMPSVMKRMAEMFHIEDDAALEEFRQLGLKMLSGQVPMPGSGGQQQPGQENPIAAVLGSALGQQGGNVNGGGAGGPLGDLAQQATG